MLRKILSLALALAMLLPCFACAEEAAGNKPVVVLFTNDVHCGYTDNIGYAGLVAYEKAYEQAGYEVVLADCGDSIQGAAIGTLSEGGYIIDIMNKVGYDVATIGNHEFDYGMERFMELKDAAQFPYVAANFTDLEGSTVLDAYVIMELGSYSVAFVGVATPETFSKSTPTYFQDEDGNYIYSFCEGNDGADLYAAVQTAVDDAVAEGAEIVIALAHLGTDTSSMPWTSSELIANTSGIDVVLDGHSHSTIPGELVLNSAGEKVLLASTGTKLAAVGALTITSGDDGVVFSGKLHNETLFQDAETAAYIAGIEAQFTDTLSSIVATTEVQLTIADPVEVDENGKPIRIVRSQETNLGDLCADAYRYMSGADIALVNGGGIRASIPAGEISYEQIIAVYPYGNSLSVCEATGQEILDALEMAARELPAENGGFLQVSGITFEINVAVEPTVVLDDKEMFVEVAGERRVQNVLVGGEPIDPDATYTLASADFLMENSGDGYSMFADNNYLLRGTMIDNQILINYISEALGGVVGDGYSDPYGQGRIVIIG